MAKILKIERIQLDPGISRIVFLGDPHGDIESVKEILAREENDQTQIACVGDVVGYADGPQSSLLCDYMQSKKIPTTEGNHEDWLDSDGKLFLAPKYSDKKLTDSARRWIKDLPQIIEFYQDGDLICKMTHAIFYPSWNWVSKTNIEMLFVQLGNPHIIITGHSHRPCVYTVDNPITQEYFNFLEKKELDVNIDRPTLIDAGSVGRPEYVGRTDNPMSRSIPPHNFGTYAVIDLSTYSAQLRRVKKIIEDDVLRFE